MLGADVMIGAGDRRLDVAEHGVVTLLPRSGPGRYSAMQHSPW
jgi:hypothetical protein